MKKKKKLLFQGISHKSSVHLPKHLENRVDTSCKNVIPPHIGNGDILFYKNMTLVMKETDNDKYYTTVYYKCHAGFKFRKSHPGVMFCSRGEWIGREPICEKRKRKKGKKINKHHNCFTDFARC